MAVKASKKTATGLVETDDSDQKERDKVAAPLKPIDDIDVASLHRTLNTTKCIVVCRDLFNCTEEEITSELASQGLVGCLRLTVRRDGQTLLTVNRTTVTHKIKAIIHRVNLSKSFHPSTYDTPHQAMFLRKISIH